MMKTVIMAGGRGTRVSTLFPDLPKPLIPIEGKPILEREIDCLREQGFKDIILTVSYLGEKIKEYFGDGSKFGVNIKYYFENEPLGNAGALFRLKDELKEDFLLINADSLFDVDLNRFVQFHKEKGGLATLLVHPNSHPYDSGLIISNKDGLVVKWLAKEDERPKWYKNQVNAGIHILSPSLLKQEINSLKIDLDRNILKPLVAQNKVYCYKCSEYVKDMGSPERYFQVCKDYQNNLISQKNLKHKQKAIFLDRDGTINKYVGFLRKINDFELLPGVSDAIKKINASGYLAIVVTNQPVIARGEVTFEELEEIHNKMETLLGEKGAYLDAIYFCPHHPQKGYDGEIPELKIDCNCRKPKPGMLIKAAEDFNIDLAQSWMIGDEETDVLAGLAAGCRTIRIDEKTTLLKAIGLII